MSITAKKSLSDSTGRICQGDIFKNIVINESIKIDKDVIYLEDIMFPFVVCLNQECDLVNDFQDPVSKNSHLLHLAVAPAFIFDSFISGKHWGGIFEESESINVKKTPYKVLTNNENPRYHYLEFPENESIPKLIIDFKHFFTINRDFLYSQMEKKICSIEPLFREKISQRFSYFISRIGLPV